MKSGGRMNSCELIDRRSGLIIGARCILSCDWRGMACDITKETTIGRLAWISVLSNERSPYQLSEHFKQRVQIRSDYLLEIRDRITPELWRKYVIKFKNREGIGDDK
jgi:hypothetical protein